MSMATMSTVQPVNILMVDDQPAKLLSYEAMLGELGENLIRAGSGKEALEQLLKHDVAVILMDVCMPELDGFELASLIHRHPRFQKTAIIHVSAVNLTDPDRLRGYDCGAVDYVSVPVVPEVLRAKVRVFADLYRKTQDLERLNEEWESRARERTRQLEDTAARLGQSEERFKFLAETIPSFVWTAAADGTNTYMNQRWFHYCGLSADVDARDWKALVVHPDDRQRVQSRWAEAVRSLTDYEIEVRIRRHDGGYRWFLTRAVPHRDADGRVLAWFGVTTDIHDQKLLMEELHQADRRKDEFLAMLSHELRNPLAVIATALEVVRHPARSDDDARQGLARIDRQTRHLTRLIEDLLDVNRIAHDKVELRKEAIELADVVHSAVESCGSLEDRTLTMNLPAEPIILDADRVRLTQALANILSNAAKFTPADGRIALGAEREDNFLVLRVTDTGIGIAPEALPHIFDTFYQADHLLEGAHGSLGLGLTVARRLIELHGGTIEAASAGLGKGSEFLVRLPLAKEAIPRPVAPASAATATAIPSRRVLVADDNRDSVESLALLLRLNGHEVEIAHDGEEAVAKAERFKPQVALLDIGMPRLNGHQVARQLRQRPWGKRLLLIAATGWAEEREPTQDSGFDAHLVKPVNPAALMKLLAEADPRGSKRSRHDVERVARPSAREALGSFDARAVGAPAASAGHTPDGGASILVVDDFPGAREVYSRLLALSGYRVEAAASGPEALEKSFGLQPEMILMDLAMPGMDGWETIRRLKADARTRNSRIVIVTGAAYGGGAKRAKEAGCDAYLIKPCLPETLLEVVRALLSKKST